MSDETGTSYSTFQGGYGNITGLGGTGMGNDNSHGGAAQSLGVELGDFADYVPKVPDKVLPTTQERPMMERLGIVPGMSQEAFFAQETPAQRDDRMGLAGSAVMKGAASLSGLGSLLSAANFVNSLTADQTWKNTLASMNAPQPQYSLGSGVSSQPTFANLQPGQTMQHAGGSVSKMADGSIVVSDRHLPNGKMIIRGDLPPDRMQEAMRVLRQLSPTLAQSFG